MLNDILGSIIDFMYTYLLIAILIGAGLYFFIRTKALPLRLFAESVRVVTEKPQDEKSISSFRALMLSTASRVGVGNIAGVASAVALGGAGAVFWMWLIAFLGASTAFVESTLAQVYKRRSAHGHSYGGPAHYIEQALKTPWLGYIFAFSLIATYVGGFNLVASYSVKEAFSTYGFFNEATTPYVIGLILAVLVAGAVFGGIKKLSSVTVVLVPLMAMIYIVLSLVLIVVNITQVPAVFAEIFRSAFDFQAIFGAFAGSAVMQGIKRGLYSNEAGVGSAPNAAATASVSHPVKQGLVQMLSVWIDTAIICTATALAVLSSGIEGSEDLKGVPLVQDAWATVFGSMGPHMVTAALCVFAFTTLIGNYSYAESNLQFILRREPRQWELMLFRGASAVIVFAGAIAEFSLAWNIADILMGVLVLINVPTILILGNTALRALDDYMKQRRAGKNPVYVAAENGVKEDVDYWHSSSAQ